MSAIGDQSDPTRCRTCGERCPSCDECAGVIEIIQVDAKQHEFRCCECGYVRATYPAGDRAVQREFGECPECRLVDETTPDHLISCLNGHPESANKFLIAAVTVGVRFSCTECGTDRFKLRNLMRERGH